MRVAKLDHIVLHNKSEGGKQGLNGDVGAEHGVASEVASNLAKSLVCIDIGIHTYGIGSEEAGVRRDIKIQELLFEIVGALEIGLLLASYSL